MPKERRKPCWPCLETVFAGEGVRLDADSDDGGGGGLSVVTDSCDVRARSLHPLGLENVVDPKS